MEPGLFEQRAYIYAVQSYYDFEHYGFPCPGTIRDQPFIWKLAVDCVRDAYASARAQASALAEENRQKEMEKPQD